MKTLLKYKGTLFTVVLMALLSLNLTGCVPLALLRFI